MTAPAMELTWGADFDVFAETTRRLCEGSTEAASSEAGPCDRPELWQQLATLGWATATDPAASDPEAATLASIAGLFVELGRALAVTPLLPALSAHELRTLSRQPRSARDDSPGHLSIPVLFDSLLASRTAPIRARGSRLAGTAMFVPYADRADEFLVGVCGDGAQRILAVPATTPGLRVEPLPNIAGYPQGAVCFDGVDTTGFRELAAGPRADRICELVLQRAAVLQVAEMYGAGCALLDKTVRFATDREQFGGPIGRFQAVQYLCTDIAVNIHVTSAFARAAAAGLDSGESAAGPVALMRMQAAKTAQIMVHCAHEVHAGIGFMLEADVHLFTRAAKRWQFTLGSGLEHARVVVSDLTNGREVIA
ncbi:acyl-CoA dehydrogenase family protein [Mycobacterium spongiae]|uniref:Acyl-CoA dehydrogenase/oxidase C-terminal domain-containing protein n=1 Tax=Mycobacterium spongiae TaxID=886343 RepID=A0A975PXG7_9MYCO|nr:acyl-CoA dehydrogenase family protein [Mycobacterium spongiae]QUR67799.1 hypothetical protein F6B93_12420 [Mycobacterium spongiae]